MIGQWLGARVRWNHPGYDGPELHGTVVDVSEGVYIGVRWDCNAPDDVRFHYWPLARSIAGHEPVIQRLPGEWVVL